MNTLIIDCSAGMSVYVLKNDERYFKIDNDQKRHTDELLLVVDNLLNDSGILVKDLNNICVCVGPGSFTGIRVAISICKGLAIGSGARVFVASNFDIIEEELNKNKIYVLEGFSKFLYIRRYENENKIEECIAVDDLVNYLKFNNFEIIVQNEKVQKLLNKYEINSKIAQNNTIFCFFNKIKNNDCIDLNQISPTYLRASQAEMERNAKISGVK